MGSSKEDGRLPLVQGLQVQTITSNIWLQMAACISEVVQDSSLIWSFLNFIVGLYLSMHTSADLLWLCSYFCVREVSLYWMPLLLLALRKTWGFKTESFYGTISCELNCWVKTFFVFWHFSVKLQVIWSSWMLIEDVLIGSTTPISTKGHFLMDCYTQFLHFYWQVRIKTSNLKMIIRPI